MSARASSPSSTCSSTSSGLATPSAPFARPFLAAAADGQPDKKRLRRSPSAAAAASGPYPPPPLLSAFDLLLSAASTMDDQQSASYHALARTPSPPAGARALAQPLVAAAAAAGAAPASSALPPALPNFPPAPSSVASSTSSSSSTGDVKMAIDRVSLAARENSADDEAAPVRPEDLTSKGKKRKRLAKACSCLSQEQAPLLCEFSGRECIYVSSSGQRVSAPRSTRPSSTEAATASEGSSSAASPALVAAAAVIVAAAAASTSSSSSTGRASSSTSEAKKRTKTLVDQIFKPSPLSMGQSTLSEGFFAARTANLAPAPAASSSSRGASPNSSRPPSSQLSPLWEGGRTPPAVRAQVERRSSFVETKARLESQSGPRVDPLLKRSLVKSFFEHFAEPLSSIFHKPTFFSALYEDRTSPLLLNSIYAWSARFSLNPSLVELSPECRLRGEVFASQVRSVVERPEWIEQALHGGDAVDPEEEVERAQALVLLTLYESLLRRGTRTLQYLDVLVPFVTRLTQQDNPPPPPTDFGPSRAASTARELRSRLFWTTYVLAASLEAQSGRSLSVSGPKGFSAQDCRLALPISDDRFEMGACGEGLRSDGLTHPEAGSSKVLISELGHLARVQRIFRDIMSSVSGTTISRSPRLGGPVDHEASLKTWAQTLPAGLQFNETNLKAAVDRIHHRPVGDGTLTEETTGPGGDSGHAFAVLHTAAEVAMFFQLQTVRTTRNVDAGQDQYLARRQSQAIDNIVFVLNAVGEKGRQNPCLFFPLYIASKWKASSGRHAADLNVAAWWAETGQLWGFDLDVILDRGFIDITPHSSPPSAPVRPALSSASSFDSAAAFSSTSAPSTANTSALPSPMLERGSPLVHRLPSIQTLHSSSQSVTGISLPSPSAFATSTQLPPLDASPRSLGLPSASFRRSSVSDASALPSFPLQQNPTHSPSHGFALPAPFSSLNRQRSVSNASSTHTVTGGSGNP